MMITTTTTLSFDPVAEHDLIIRFRATHSNWQMTSNTMFSTFTQTKIMEIKSKETKDEV